MRVNGVDVIPLVEAELYRRFLGCADRRHTSGWAARPGPRSTGCGRPPSSGSMPAGTVDVSIGLEWSFAPTLRHLVMATDAWLGRAIVDIEQPLYPIGHPNVEYETDGSDVSMFVAVAPSYADVLEVRKNPWASAYSRDLRCTCELTLICAPCQRGAGTHINAARTQGR